MPELGLSAEPLRRETLAINLCDLDRVATFIRGVMFAGKLDFSPIMVDRERFDETAVAFTCDLLTAACLCDVLRQHDRNAGDYPTRVYLRRARVWARLPGDAVLSRIGRDGSPELNPALFPITAPPLPAVLPTVTAVEW